MIMSATEVYAEEVGSGVGGGGREVIVAPQWMQWQSSAATDLPHDVHDARAWRPVVRSVCEPPVERDAMVAWCRMRWRDWMAGSAACRYLMALRVRCGNSVWRRR